VRLWDAGTGSAIGKPLTGHTGGVLAVAFGRVNGRDVIVSGGKDSTGAGLGCGHQRERSYFALKK
jgi:hypothetical protein